MEESPIQIREVWAYNLDEELTLISKLAEKYTFVGMDTEFPGFLAKSPQSFQPKEQRYQVMSTNINLTHIIQIGITLGDTNGELCKPCCTWQFNFKFKLTESLYSPQAINLLKQAEIDFTRFEQEGIESIDFAALLFASGLILNPKVVWVCFHGSYDFGYLLKMLSGSPLPFSEEEFMVQVSKYFPNFYDLKYVVSKYESKSSGLQETANELGVKRFGTQHQAGSDSFVTLLAFYKYMEFKNHGKYTSEMFRNKLFGFSS
ncbi:CAF1 family ribonuclease containing protein [Histomonas meleagridis]|uniref:CAF1 family ribonuclease containing protein n=1 Tax=Histomonas meleagridis TaxID=135588 RepID=UPI003559F980|nr:CAF1 family ribonuclease containing protein [Histomonas meleagridis]KAH0797509.1 CAF1 family ribonuclease containing protein [Histomonas meleagridis]